jgi:diguanylate cyclase (GGDEF)-like protein
MMIDLDDFKDVNDRHGHIIGDMLLEDLAHFIKTTVPDDTIVSRYGGEEFVVFMSGLDDKEAHTIAEQLREAIADQTFVYDGHALSVKVSIGIACGTMGPSVDLVREIDAADKAMYASKDGGKNRVTTCNDD